MVPAALIEAFLLSLFPTFFFYLRYLFVSAVALWFMALRELAILIPLLINSDNCRTALLLRVTFPEKKFLSRRRYVIIKTRICESEKNIYVILKP